MRSLILVATACLVLGTSAFETALIALDPSSRECSDDDRCPPFSDDCGDCLNCVHASAVLSVLPVVLPVTSMRDVGAVPAIGHGRAPSDAPANEILTVPRA